MEFKYLLLFFASYFVLGTQDSIFGVEVNGPFFDFENWEKIYELAGNGTNASGHYLVKRSVQRTDPKKQNLAPKQPSVETPATSFENKPKIGMYDKNPCRVTNCGRPLMITPLIESGKVAEAVAMAAVPKNSSLSSVKSYSGFFTINATVNNNIFFWYFPAMEEMYAPVVVRLQGGPGQSAFFDIFNGVGPFRLGEKLNVLRNPNTLARTANLLYFDNPVGTGFSHTNLNAGYPTTQEAVAEQLHSALNQFLQLFPEHKDNYVYLSGEGYGAKYALALSKQIYDLKGDSPINLKGIILGSPFLDPDIIFNSGHYLFEVGILDESEHDIIDRRLKQARNKAISKNFSEAMDIVEEIFGSPYRLPVDKKYYIPEMTGISSQYNIMDVHDAQDYTNYFLFVNQTMVRQALHVGSLPFQDGRKAYDALRNNILQSSKNDLSTVLDQYRILIYNGNYDKKTPISLTSDIFECVNWRHLEEFKNNDKMLWKLKNDDNIHVPIGYIRKARHFFQALVLNSGHYVARDQPEAVYDAINRFIWGRAYETIKY